MSQRRFFSLSHDFVEVEQEDGCLVDIPPEDEWGRNCDPHRIHYPSVKALRDDSRVVKVFPRTRRGIFIAVASVLVVLGVFLLCFWNQIRILLLRRKGVPPGLYSENGKLMVGGEHFMIKGFSWYGMEEAQRMPGGLDKVTVGEVLDFADRFNFNAIRLPLSVENVEENAMGHTQSFLNPELAGLLYMDVVQQLVHLAAERNVLVLLDMHRLKSNEVQSGGLWYSEDVKEERLLSTWKTLCDRLGGEWNVMGADIYNEPWDAMWNSSSNARDWKNASERLGNSVHESCPSWLIFIEGVGNRAGGTETPVFWAENLAAIQDAPPSLELRKKVVLSPHVYGPSVYNHSYFEGEDFADAMPAIWDDHFGKAAEKTGLATVIGEWGGKHVGKDRQWQEKFYEYIRKKQISFFYWCLNPESVDTGGLLSNDWSTPEKNRLSMMSGAPSSSVAEKGAHFKLLRDWRIR